MRESHPIKNKIPPWVLNILTSTDEGTENPRGHCTTWRVLGIIYAGYNQKRSTMPLPNFFLLPKHSERLLSPLPFWVTLSIGSISKSLTITDFFFVHPGPAPESVTNKIFEQSKNIKEYKICKDLKVDLEKLGSQTFDIQGRSFEVEIVDSVTDYVEYMKELFDFPLLKKFIGDGFKVIANGMHGGMYSSNLPLHFVDFLVADRKVGK